MEEEARAPQEGKLARLLLARMPLLSFFSLVILAVMLQWADTFPSIVMALLILTVLLGLAGAAFGRGVAAKLVSIAVILLVFPAAATIPSLCPSKMLANESAAITSMRQIDRSRRSHEGSLALALADTFDDRSPYPDGSFHSAGHGFTTEELKGFGGECIVARPLEYGRSGLMVFVLVPDGTIYQRDWGSPGGCDPTSWDPNSPDRPWLICE